MLYNFGIEGESYEMQDGKPVYTDLVLNNPDGLTANQALSEYSGLAVGNGPFVRDRRLPSFSIIKKMSRKKRWKDGVIIPRKIISYRPSQSMRMILANTQV